MPTGPAHLDNSHAIHIVHQVAAYRSSSLLKKNA